jgi:hypothetical protein
MKTPVTRRQALAATSALALDREPNERALPRPAIPLRGDFLMRANANDCWPLSLSGSQAAFR